MAINPTASVNNEAKPANISHSTFKDFKYHLAGQYRFGECSPCYVADVVPDDKLPLRSDCKVRSYSLKAPLMSDVFIKKLYAAVPRECILPLNWEKIYKNPKVGSDINAGIYGTSVSDFQNLIKSCLDFYYNQKVSGIVADEGKIQQSVKYLIACEYIYSAGSLLNILGCKLWRLCSSSSNEFKPFDLYFDSYFDSVVTAMGTTGFFYVQPFSGSGFNVYATEELAKENGNSISLRKFLEFARDDFRWTITTCTFSSPLASQMIIKSDLSVDKKPIDLARCFAYQIVCASFLTNPNVDYVYNADLYRQNIYSLLATLNDGWLQDTTGFPFHRFTWNGISCSVDALSAINFKSAISEALVADDNDYFDILFDYWRLIFGFNRSLKYGDYFTGAKSRALAIGSTSVAVVGGQVDVVDVTKKIQAQRFLNRVNRLPGRMKDYVKGVFGIDQQQDFHEPIYLHLTSDQIYDSEVENTGSDQLTKPQSVTSTLRQQSSDFIFDFNYIDRPMIVIGIQYFDIPRYYDSCIERPFFHVDRFDMFNPDMQYIGDQQVYLDELYAPHLHELHFAYQQRHMEYKQRFNQCFGAFSLGLLPGWEFIADEGTDMSLVNHIGPDYIRSSPSEFDRYFVSLTGWSYGTYFHFIVDHNNLSEPRRPMVFNPQIL